MSKKTEIKALISLLDDEDEAIVENVSNKLLSFGEEVIFNLENSWEKTINPLVHERIEGIIHEIQFNLVYKALKNWLRDPFPDLFKGAEIIAKYQYPDLDSENTRAMVEGIKQKIWLEMNNDLTPLETISVFNHVFYGYLGFGGDYKSKPDVSDFCINHVLESKKGASITLGIIYVIVAQELNLPVYGVNLHRHFILSYQKRFIEHLDQDHASESMFYINAMNKGIVFEREEIKSYLKKMKKEAEVKFFSPASNQEVINELLYYMGFLFKNNNQENRADEIKQLRKLF
ncbi:MAG: regulator of sirC expression with transglutaminase-like and TPR domain [Planctomycetota bacterium]|jgi:regulator of sirC expression with transglutaminase-like and TPR domain